MSIVNFKMPKIKFKKMKIHAVDEFEEIDYEKLQKKNTKQKRYTPYEDNTSYKTIKEGFLDNVKKYPKEDCILEKPSHKEPYKIITYQEFKEDVWALGTALIRNLNLKDKKIVIVGETQYNWYVSYMAMLCGVGIAVPTDRELPINELENIIKRSRASAIIYSSKKASDIKEIRERLPEVEYYIEMKSDKPLDNKDVGINYLIDLGKHIISSGDTCFDEIVHFYPEAALVPYCSKIRNFKNGAFDFAVKNDVPIVPIVFVFREPKGIRKILKRKQDVTLKILEPVTAKNNDACIKENVNELKNKVQERMKEVLRNTLDNYDGKC